jgi:hypothetical protein
MVYIGGDMSNIVPFNEKEMEVTGIFPNIMGMPPFPRFNMPVSPKENFFLAYKGEKPCWFPNVIDVPGTLGGLRPRIMPDNIVCGLVVDGESQLTPKDFSGKGWFDTEWVYVESAGGAIVKPGKPQLPDANDWEKIAKFPDIESYDWKASADANKNFIDRTRMVEVCMLCGFYERLMAFMDVENAVIALIDEDQKSAVHAFFDRLCILYDAVIGKFKKHYNPDIILMHDDWGHERSTFFSPDTYEEMILPYITRLVESCHKRGILYEQHSCGKIERFVPFMIKAGIDIWQGQDMNDKDTLIDKYGKDIFLGVTVPLLPPGTPEEEQYKNVETFINKYKGKRMFATVYPFDKTYEYLYKQSRIAFSGD